jgi:hypothetical protein
VRSSTSASQPLREYFQACSSAGSSLEFSRSSVVDRHRHLTHRIGFVVCLLVASIHDLRTLTKTEHIRG